MSRFSLAFVLIAALTTAAQDSATPAPKVGVHPPAPGDRSEIKIESTFELDIVSSSDQDPDAKVTRQLTYARTLECSQVVQSVAENGVPTLRVSVSTARLQRSGTNIAPVTETSEIESQSYIVTKTDKGRVVKAESGDVAPLDASGLGAWEDFSALLPKDEPKEGATWTVDAAAIAAIVSIPDLPTPTGTIEAKVESIADGKTTVLFTGSLEGKTVKGFDTKLKVSEGRLVFDMAKGRPASFSVTGSLEATKDITQKVSRQKELRQVDEKVGSVTVTSRKLEVRAEFR
jgi:hypothetical protein